MINLIKNELIKIFHKKIIYILLIISLGFIILTNVITNSTTYEADFSNSNKDYIQQLIAENEKMDLTNQSNIEWYINNKTQIDIYNLQEKYGFDSWQSSLVSLRLYNTIYSINYNTYSKASDKEILKTAQKEYSQIIARFDTNNWQSFVNDEIKELKVEKTALEKELKTAKGTTETTNLKSQLYQVEVNLEVLNLRLDKNISYGDDYLNNAINTYENSKIELFNYQNKDLTNDEQKEYDRTKSNMETSKYIVDTGKDINESKSMRITLKSFYDEYLFLIVAIIIVISGVIVSEEYNKGTIKLLLIRPYSRTKILLSKYITCIIMLIFIILSFFILQNIVGYFFFGASSLTIPVVNYNLNTSSLSILNVYSYLGLHTLVMLPKLILLMTLAFSLSTLFGHSAIAIAVTLIGFVGSDILNYMIIYKDVKFMKYWVTLNWDFDAYLFGGSPIFKYVNLNFSIITCLIYFLIMIIVSFIVFKKKNIKNI